MMNYKNYIGHVNYDYEAKIFHGEIINTRDVITFQGKSVAELEKAMRNSVDDYIKWCREEGEEPERPYSGKFNIRISPELHRQLAIVSRANNMSQNKFIENVLEQRIYKS